MSWLKNINLILLVPLLCAFLYYFNSYHREKKENTELTAKLITITTQLDHYQSEVKRYSDIASSTEKKKRELERERETTSKIIENVKNEDACFNSLAPTLVVERLREQATKSH